MRRFLILLIKAYRILLSPYLGGQCRFHPSCSAYSLEAIERFGSWRGGWLMVRRIARCQPLCTGGYDPVPGAEASHTSDNEKISTGNTTHG